MSKVLFSILVLCSIQTLAQEPIPLINSSELIDQGVKLHDQGKYKEALELYNSIPVNDSNYVLALHEKALTCQADSQFKRGLEYCKEALMLKKDRGREAGLYNLYGSILDDMDEFDKAITVYDSALKLYPSYNLLHLNKAITLNKMKKYAEAENILQQALLADPYNSSCHFQLGLSAVNQGKIIPAFLSLASYLLISPDGRYSTRAINLLSAISKNDDQIVKLASGRTSESSENFQMIEQIVASKIALDKGYKLLVSLDDQICRQMQVVFEKLEYDAGDKDFYVQYYVPFFKKEFSDKKFEPLVFEMFSAVNLEPIAKYNAKNKKEIKQIIDDAVAYFNLIRLTRQLDPAKRNIAGNNYFFEDGNLSSHGYKSGDLITGEWFFYFPQGNLKARGVYNQNGKKEGTWKYYYVNNNLDGEETFKNGELDGPVAYYHENGSPLLKGMYSAGNKKGEFTRYYNTGAINTIENYKDGKLNGIAKVYYQSGLLKSVENYINDEGEGAFTTYYSNGAIEKQGILSKGKLAGPYRVMHENGVLALEGAYQDGKATGAWKRYFESGKLKSNENYVNDALDGPYEEYHDNGQLYTKSTYRKGKITGESPYYAEDGKLFSVVVYENDRIKSARYLDKSGKQISYAESKDKKINFAAYSDEGYKLAETAYDEKGNMTGTRSYFFNSGTLKETESYKAGELDGPDVAYFPNKNKKFQLNYLAGNRNGYYTSYYYNGNKNEEGWYKNNLAQGTWKKYDVMGHPESVKELVNDELHGTVTNYWPNGKISDQSLYNEGIIEAFIQYDSSGKIIDRTNFTNGSGKIIFYDAVGRKRGEGSYLRNLHDGKWQFNFFDGKIETLRFYKNGMPDSIYREYFYNGKIYAEGQYAAGNKTGTWKYYDKDGKLHSTSQFVNGKQQGKETYYFENGHIYIEADYKDDDYDGLYKMFDETGLLLYQVRFEKGRVAGYSYLDKNNSLVPEIKMPGAAAKAETYFPNGKLSAIFEYIDGLVTNDNKTFYPNGNLRSEGHENYGNTEGQLKNYYSNGGLKSLYHYTYNELDGPFSEINEKGKVTSEGHYFLGQLNGPYKYYDANGKATETRFYYFGQLLDVKK